MSQNINSETTILDISKYAKGLYMLAVTLDGETVTRNVIRK